MAVAADSNLVYAVSLLAAGVVAVPLFKRLGLGSVLGYLTAGVVIGPFGFGLFTDPESILHVAELGVVMFLFLIGLEMQPSRLWGLRREIFGLGLAQVLACGLLLTVLGIGAGLAPAVAFVAGLGFTISSTAIVMQILEERGDQATREGQRIISILLLEDLSIVPLLAIVALLGAQGAPAEVGEGWMAILIALGAVAALVVAGRWLLNPFFRLLANAHAREVMTAAALLVVLGSALAMQLGGLSMALGAFVAGVLLSQSTFRHQLEADIEPFRGILLGLFFLSVGMSLDLAVIREAWPVIAAAVVGLMAVKMAGIVVVGRLFGAKWPEALTRAGLLAQGGEFAFVLYAAAAAAGVFDARINSVLTATVIISMALTPLLVLGIRRLLPSGTASLDGIDVADGLEGSVLVIGFGRFGQIVSQPLLLRGLDVSIIDVDVEMIQAAANFGFKVYYGDGTRLDILHAAGAGRARAVLVCVDKADVALKIIQTLKADFPQVRVLARAYDRAAAIQIIAEGVDYQIRETLESAMLFGQAALEAVGIEAMEAAEIMEDVRRRDAARLEAQIEGGIQAGRAFMKGNMPVPTPLAPPRRPGRVITIEPADAPATAATEKEPLPQT